MEIKEFKDFAEAAINYIADYHNTIRDRYSMSAENTLCVCLCLLFNQPVFVIQFKLIFGSINFLPSSKGCSIYVSM